VPRGWCVLLGCVFVLTAAACATTPATRDTAARSAAHAEADTTAGVEQLPLHDQEARCDSLKQCARKLLYFGRKHRRHLPGV